MSLVMPITMPTPCVTIAPLLPRGRRSTEENNYNGDGRDILLQGFHWDSHFGAVDSATRTKKSWYRILLDNATTIRSAGFSWVWFPPPSDSLAPQGYMPRRWNVLDSAFGTEAELTAAVRALAPVKALADIVVNHRVGVATTGADFEEPPFPDNRAAITKDDDSGVGTGNADTGDQNAAGRDLDHTNPDVRACIKAYLRRLKAVGFQGWRYDLVKGYHGRFVGEYNDATAPDLSVGEFFDGDRQKVTNWINATGGKTMAFDFPTRYLLFDSCTRDDYSSMRTITSGRTIPSGLIGFWPSRSVTFLDNHDTEYGRESAQERENNITCHFTGKMAALGYVYILTHPGIPCVFWRHYFDWGNTPRQQINQLLKVRKNASLHAGTLVNIKEARQGLYAAILDGQVAVKLGSSDWSPGCGWQLALDGEKFAVWTRCK